MGKMKQMWKLTDIKQRLKPVREGKYKEEEMIDALFGIGTDMARKAKSEHDYHNIKGQLESSIGVVIVKNRRELVRWSVLATSGSDPALGIRDMEKCLSSQILGKSELPDGTEIPANGLACIVFAAAPYAAAVQWRKKKVLLEYAPSDAYVFSIINKVVK